MSETFYEATKNLSAEALMSLLNSPQRESLIAFTQANLTRDFPELNKGGASC